MTLLVLSCRGSNHEAWKMRINAVEPVLIQNFTPVRNVYSKDAEGMSNSVDMVDFDHTDQSDLGLAAAMAEWLRLLWVQA